MTTIKQFSICLLLATGMFGQVNYNTQLRNLPAIPAEKYQFTIRPANITSGSLAAYGAKTLTLQPCPLHLNGADSGHYIRISGGTGTAENVLITGGTCTNGSSGGTLSFTTVNDHSGSYSITSASGGIQEAVNYAQSLANGGHVVLAQGNTTIYRGVVLAGSPAVTVSGCGTWCSNIIMDSTMTSGDAFSCSSGTCLVYFRDMLISGHSAHAAGAAIHVEDNAAGRPKIENVMAADTFGGFWIDNSDYVQILNSYYDQTANTSATYGIKIEGVSSDIQVKGGRYAAPETNVSTMLDYGLWITGGDGVSIDGAMFRGNIGVYIEPTYGSGSLLLGSIFITGGTIIDRCRTNGIKILSAGVSAGNDFFGEIYFSNTHVAGDSAMEINDLVYIDLTTMGTTYAGISFVGMKINNSNRHGIYAANVNGLNISSSRIVNNDVSNGGAGAISIAGATYLVVNGNTLSDFTAVPKQNWGLTMSGTITGAAISGNTASGNTASPYNNGATLTSAVLSGNQGSDDLVGSATAAATVTLATSIPKTIAITGTTTINTINGYLGSGDTRTFICPSGLTFSAAGNIAAARTTTMADQIVRCVYSSGSSKWFCQ